LSGISCAGSIERGGGQPALQIGVMFGHPSAFFVVLELPNLHHFRVRSTFDGTANKSPKKPNKNQIK
jgi:hypothetical protein